MKKIVIFLLAAVMITSMSTAAFGAGKDFKMPVVGIEEGNAIPDFTLVDLNGKKTNIKDYRGKVVFLNFWATWCPPCRQEMPSMETLWQKSKGKPFVILAVSVDDADTKKVADFIAKNKYTFPVFHDVTGELSQQFLIRSIPTTFILDTKGIIIEKMSGAADWSTLNVDELAKGKR